MMYCAGSVLPLYLGYAPALKLVGHGDAWSCGARGASLIKVVDVVESCGVRDEGSALGYARTLLEGRAVLQIVVAFTLHELNLLLEFPGSLLLVSYHLAHLGL
jgi:hypothetical protein